MAKTKASPAIILLAHVTLLGGLALSVAAGRLLWDVQAIYKAERHQNKAIWCLDQRCFGVWTNAVGLQVVGSLGLTLAAIGQQADRQYSLTGLDQLHVVF